LGSWQARKYRKEFWACLPAGRPKPPWWVAPRSNNEEIIFDLSVENDCDNIQTVHFNKSGGRMATLNGKPWLRKLFELSANSIGSGLVNASLLKDGVGVTLVLSEYEERILRAMGDARGFGNSNDSLGEMIAHVMRRYLAGEGMSTDSFTYDYIYATRTFSTHRPNPKVRQFDVSGMNESMSVEPVSD
jgi:hypothetical protein